MRFIDRDPITSLTLTTEHENPLKYLITSRPYQMRHFLLIYQHSFAVVFSG